jgi:hypothetical protein
MLNKRTVFIFGAGAHVPYGFPTMEMLKKDIITNFEYQYRHFFSNEFSKKIGATQAKEFINSLRYSNIDSIDLFLFNNQGYSNYDEIGKSAIFYNLLSKELLFLNDTYKNDKSSQDIYSDNWFNILFNKMIDRRMGKEGLYNFGTQNVTFITFNYDRLLEFLFFRSLVHTYKSYDEKEIVATLKKLDIYHVYGSLGELNYTKNSNESGLKFGEMDIQFENNGVKRTGDIKLIHERNELSKEVVNKIESAERIFFLGFGFAPENLSMLKIPTALNQFQKVYGTGYGWEPGQIKWITNYLKKNQISLTPEVEILDLNCSRLLNNCINN